MPITDLLERNSKLYGEEIALVEINPEIQEAQRVARSLVLSSILMRKPSA